jgi:hypothetical protein
MLHDSTHNLIFYCLLFGNPAPAPQISTLAQMPVSTGRVQLSPFSTRTDISLVTAEKAKQEWRLSSIA